jgi:hypothetical protein
MGGAFREHGEIKMHTKFRLISLMGRDHPEFLDRGVSIML